MELIKEGDVIIVQRQNFMKTHKLGKKSHLMQLGRDCVDLSPIIGHPYGSWFKLNLAEGTKKRRNFNLSHTEEIKDFDELLPEDESGRDNRNIFDSGAFPSNSTEVASSQKLSREDIESMRDQGMEGAKIIEELIENSTSFSQRTRFSQEKFVKKKSQKYFPYLLIRRPTIRLLSEVLYSIDPMKILNLRIDSLAQMLNSVNVRAGGKYMVYETGSQGLLLAAVLDRVIFRSGSTDDDQGKVVHVFQPGSPQLSAVQAMNFGDDQIQKYVSALNIFHLRSLENGEDLYVRPNHVKPDPDAGDCEGPFVDDSSNLPKRKTLRESSTESYELLKQKDFDGLLIACKQHPKNLLLSLMKYLSPSRPFVVFSPYQEPLMDTYFAVKETGKAVMVMLTETWLRNYQVLPDRTHPEVMMSGGGGYILSGLMVDNTEIEADDEGSKPESSHDTKTQGRKRRRND